MSGHNEAAAFAQLVNHVLLHVEVLHEEEVRAIHRLSPDTNLVCLMDKTVTVFVSGDIILFISVVRVDAHVVGDTVVVVTQGLIDAVDGLFFALAAISQAEELARMAVEVVFLPQVGVHILIGVVEVFAAEGLGLLEAIGRNGEVDIQNHQQQSNADASHYSAEVEPETVFFCLIHAVWKQSRCKIKEKTATTATTATKGRMRWGRGGAGREEEEVKQMPKTET